MKIADQWFRDTLRCLYQRRTATRGEVIEATRLNPACVSLTVRHLLNSGVIQMVGELHSTGGRKREVLKLNSEAGYFLVVDLEGSQIRIGLSNFLGDIRCRWEQDVNVRQAFDLRQVVEGVRMVLSSLDSLESSRVLAAGVSYTGLMDAEGRVSAVNFGWERFPLRERLGAAVGLPVFYGNDGFCKNLAERWLGVAENSRNCVYVMAGVGIGVGCYVDGHVLMGHGALAGELGHLTVAPEAADRCNCGKRGCLEAIASSPNIVRQYLEKKGGSGGLETGQVSEVYSRAREGEAEAVAVVRRVGSSLGLGLSHLVSILNPELIVLGGDLIFGQDLLKPVIEEELARHTLPMFREGLEVRVSSLGQDSGLKGAASLAFRRALEDEALLRRMTSPVVLEMRPRQGAQAAPAAQGRGRAAQARQGDKIKELKKG